jgi:hypothetical protein
MLAGMPVLANLPFEVHAGRDDGRLDRVQHVETVGHLAETVPVAALLASLGSPLISSRRRGRCPHRPACRAPDLEPPVVAVLLVHLAHRPAEVQRLGNAFLDQRGASGRLHHGGRHIAAGNDAVLRAGAGVHQVGLVEQVAVQLGGLRVLHQHLAGLADAGQQLVDGLGGIHHGALRPRALLAHGVVGAVERVEGRVRQPGLIEVQVVDVAVEQALDGLGVVEHAVVGGLRQRQHARLDLVWRRRP